jgi:molybdopterin synthase catalytic subunit
MSRKATKRITKEEIDPVAAYDAVRDPSAGGTVIFVGTVRNISGGQRVRNLEYQVYEEMAEKRMRAIEAEVMRKWPVKKVKLAHRQGRLSIGDVSVVVAVSSEHRAEAFEACRYAIDSIKRSLPLWKREGSVSGNKSWVEGSPIED